MQIEHIHPQSPTDDWSGDGGTTTGVALTNDEQAEFRTVLNTIGNLTLLEAPLNQGAGNRPFHLKASRYYPSLRSRKVKDLATRSSWNYDAITGRTHELTAEFLRIWSRPSGMPMDAPDDLVRVVDLAIPPGKADPDVFEYVAFEDQLLGDVHNVKALLARVGYTSWLRDKETFLTTDHGRLIHKTRIPRTKYVELPDGQLMYAGWAPHFLFEAVQVSLTTFGLDDRVRVKLIASD